MICFSTRFIAACLFTGVLLISSAVRADVTTLRGSDNSVWGSIGGSFLNYKEYSDPLDLPIPDREHGVLPSLAGGVSVLGPGDDRGFDNNFYAALEGSVSFGEANYAGAYFASPTTPLDSSTHETIWTIDGRFGKAFVITNTAMLIPYVEIGYRYWERNLGGGEIEDYQHVDSLGGLMVQFSPIDRLILSAYGSAGGTFGASMNTEGENYGLGSSGMYKFGGKVGWDLTQQLELFTTLDYDYFRYGQSSVQSDGTYEPNSHTEDTALRLGLGYHFK